MGNVKDSLTSGLSKVGDIFSGGLTDVFDFVKKIFNTLGDVFEKIKDILSAVKDGFVNVATSIVNKIGDFMVDVGNNFINVIDNIISIPKKIIDLLLDLLKFLFIPEYNPIEEIKAKINEKFTFLTQMVSLSADLFKDFDSNSLPPSFTITYKGTEYSIVNFEIFQPYRATVHSIIIAIAWIYFVLWLFKFAPRVIKGGG